jgi:hypothetical protein
MLELLTPQLTQREPESRARRAHNVLLPQDQLIGHDVSSNHHCPTGWVGGVHTLPNMEQNANTHT